MSDPKIRTKTFVAPCVGGPIAGRLIRQTLDIENLLVPDPLGLGNGAHQYIRKLAPDGTTIWLYVDPRSKP